MKAQQRVAGGGDSSGIVGKARGVAPGGIMKPAVSPNAGGGGTHSATTSGSARSWENSEMSSRQWTAEEHRKFLEGMTRYYSDATHNVKEIAAWIGTRTPKQTRAYLNRYLARRKAAESNLSSPPGFAVAGVPKGPQAQQPRQRPQQVAPAIPSRQRPEKPHPDVQPQPPAGSLQAQNVRPADPRAPQ